MFQCFIHTGNYEKALNVKDQSVFSKAYALYRLNRFKDCLTLIENLSETNALLLKSQTVWFYLTLVL